MRPRPPSRRRERLKASRPAPTRWASSSWVSRNLTWDPSGVLLDVVQQELGHALRHAVEAQSPHQGDQVPDLAREMAQDHLPDVAFRRAKARSGSAGISQQSVLPWASAPDATAAPSNTCTSPTQVPGCRMASTCTFPRPLERVIFREPRITTKMPGIRSPCLKTRAPAP